MVSAMKLRFASMCLLAACDSSPPEPTRARPSSEPKVASTDPQACFQRASALVRKGQSNREVLKQLECACDGKVAMACTHLGAWYRDGTVVTRDTTKSTSYYKQGCELGDGWGCSDWGVALLKGRGVERDMAAAHAAAKKGCALESAKACGNAGMQIMNGRVGKQDFAAARKLLDRGCKLGDSFSCKMLEVARDPESFLKRFRASCTSGSQKGCLNLALLLPPGSAERTELLRQACDAGQAAACEHTP